VSSPATILLRTNSPYSLPPYQLVLFTSRIVHKRLPACCTMAFALRRTADIARQHHGVSHSLKVRQLARVGPRPLVLGLGTQAPLLARSRRVGDTVVLREVCLSICLLHGYNRLCLRLRSQHAGAGMCCLMTDGVLLIFYIIHAACLSPCCLWFRLTADCLMLLCMVSRLLPLRQWKPWKQL